jgi:TetR/AcrR family transcriptional regulator, transcriptional repressor for nem operon
MTGGSVATPSRDPGDERRFTRKGQATRDRIVAAATDLIAQLGVAGTSTEQVRDAAGVSGSQLYHYFDSKQALIRAVITRQADAVGPVDGTPQLGALDSFDALQAWADAAIERQGANDGRGECNLGTLAAELSVSDEDSRAELSHGFLRWKEVLRDGLGRMQERGELRAEADLDQLAFALLTALQGGSVMSQTLRSTDPLKASMAAALGYVRSFAADA